MSAEQTEIDAETFSSGRVFAAPLRVLDAAAEGLAHIAQLKEQRLALAQEQHLAEERFAERVGAAHRGGELGDEDLVDLYFSLREASQAEPGFASRWDQAVDLDSRIIARSRLFQSLPNGPNGSWQGDNPLPSSAAAPRTGIAVVYVLYDDTLKPCYVGSTMRFRNRLAHHRRDQKAFRYWAAYPCRDREHAYAREEQMLREVLPPMNRKSGR